MKLTNKQNLPGPVVTYAHMDDYSRGQSDISVTELIDSPRIRIMKQAYGDVVTEDVADRLQPLIGHAMHHLMDQGSEPGAEAEIRFFSDIGEWRWSGCIDRVLIEPGHAPLISDYKVTNVYKVRNGSPDWRAQLLLYALLYAEHRGEWPRAEIVAFIRDWRKTEWLQAGAEKGTYPDTPILTIPILTGDEDRERPEAQALLEARYELHAEAQRQWDEEGTIVQCTDTERWARPTLYAVTTPGAKRAVKVLGSREQAHAWANGRAGLHVVVERPGENVRCASYCPYAPHCTQWREIQKDVAINKLEKLL